MRYRDDDICLVYKVVGNGKANVAVGWFDEESLDLPAFTSFFTAAGGRLPFGTSASSVASGIKSAFNEEADRGGTKGKYHFDSEGPFVIVRRNSDVVVDPLECVNRRIEILRNEFDEGRYKLKEIKVQSNGVWDFVEDPGADYFDGFLLNVARGSIITTTTVPPTLILETATKLIILHSFVDDTDFDIGETIEGQGSGATATVVAWSPYSKKLVLASAGSFTLNEVVQGQSSGAEGVVKQFDDFRKPGDEFYIVNDFSSSDPITVDMTGSGDLFKVNPGQIGKVIFDNNRWVVESFTSLTESIISGTLTEALLSLAKVYPKAIIQVSSGTTIPTGSSYIAGQTYTVINVHATNVVDITLGGSRVLSLIPDESVDIIWSGTEWLALADLTKVGQFITGDNSLSASQINRSAGAIVTGNATLATGTFKTGQTFIVANSTASPITVNTTLNVAASGSGVFVWTGSAWVGGS